MTTFYCGYCRRQCEGEQRKLRHYACVACYTYIIGAIKEGQVDRREEAAKRRMAAELLQERKCPSCNKTKPFSEFFNGKNRWERPCKRCNSLRVSAAYRKKHPLQIKLRFCQTCKKDETETKFYPSQHSGRCGTCTVIKHRERRQQLKADNGS